MIEASEAVFPNNIVSLIEARAELIDPDLEVFKRPLRASDPNQCVGIVAAQWVPDEQSKQILGVSYPAQPTLSRYLVTVQALIRDMDEERGLNVHSVLSRMLRSMLYTDQPLRVGLSALTSALNGTTESARRWGVSQQRFFSNQISGEWLYLSNLEFWLETETL